MAYGGSSRMAVVLPQGALFRKSAEGKIREALLKEDVIEAVIGLAPNLFYGTQLAGCVVIFRRKKPAERKNKVLIIDASNLFRKGRAQNFLDIEHGERIVEWFQAFEDVENRAKVVTLDEIKEEGWTLNISRYVDGCARDARYVLRRVTLQPAQGGQRFAPGRATTPAGTEDRDEDINGVEEEGRLIYEPWRVSTKNGLDSLFIRAHRT